MDKRRIAIFASGAGTNAARLMDHFTNHEHFELAFLLTNKESAGAIGEAKARKIDTLHFSNELVEKEGFLAEICANQGIDFIVLAGYLRKIPTDLILHYPNKIINIHPALLPLFGGNGMYGNRVHQAVLEAKATQTGISIHFVNQKYDDGKLIAQFYTQLTENETIETIAAKVKVLEHNYFATVIEHTFLNLN
jgi:phosphoribosylglycinamide formyltransferase 1